MEILVSMGNRLTYDISYESADNVAEVLGRFTEAAFVAGNSFSFDPGIIWDGRDSMQG